MVLHFVRTNCIRLLDVEVRKSIGLLFFEARKVYKRKTVDSRNVPLAKDFISPVGALMLNCLRYKCGAVDAYQKRNKSSLIENQHGFASSGQQESS